jgi:hypothetical protein
MMEILTGMTNLDRRILAHQSVHELEKVPYRRHPKVPNLLSPEHIVLMEALILALSI